MNCNVVVSTFTQFFSIPFSQQSVWQTQFGLRRAIGNCEANLRRLFIQKRYMIYFSYSLDLLPLVHQVSVVTYTHMWYNKMVHLLTSFRLFSVSDLQQQKHP